MCFSRKKTFYELYDGNDDWADIKPIPDIEVEEQLFK
jgi:hypothetical protein